MTSIEHHYFTCACGSYEHTIRFDYDPDDNDLYLCVFLREGPWWRRVWNALKYVFGSECMFGHFDAYLMDNEEASKLAELMSRVQRRQAEINVKEQQGFKEAMEAMSNDPTIKADCAKIPDSTGVDKLLKIQEELGLDEERFQW